MTPPGHLSPDEPEGRALFDALDEQLRPLEALSTPCWLFDVRRCQWMWGNDAALAIWRGASRDAVRRRVIRTSQSDAMYEYLNDLLAGLRRDEAPRFEWLTLEPLGIPRRHYTAHHAWRLPDGSYGVLSEAAMEPPAEEIVALAANTSLTVALFDASGAQMSQNPAFRSLLGEDFRALHLTDLLPERGLLREFIATLEPSPPRETEVALETTRGRRWYRVEHRRVASSRQEPRVLATFFDVTETRLEREELRRLARTDKLSGSLNRTGILEEAEAWVARGEPFQVLYVDLDGLKRINDVFGHRSGDELLAATAERLRRLSVEGVSGRVGGDEFIILAPPDPDLPREVRRVLSAEFQIYEARFSPTASIGVAQFPSDALDASGLIRCADRAMYRSKRAGRDKVTHFRREIDLSFERAERIAAELPAAILRGELRAVVQPIYDLSRREVVGGECLARWSSPSLGVVRPDEFIPIAEQSGAIHKIGLLMLGRAADLLRSMHPVAPSVYLSVNLSAADLLQSELPDHVEALTGSGGMEATNLHIELTERMDIRSMTDVQNTMRSLARLGCSLSLDDFGTGYASLQWLEALPFDSVKIDQSLVHRLHTHRAREMLRALSSMTASLGLHCLGEGVETEEQLETLQEVGVRTGQGFLLSRPVEEPDWLSLLRA